MIYLKMEILLQKVDFGARYALHLILTKCMTGGIERFHIAIQKSAEGIVF